MFQIALFQSDITPPLGHPLCAGWYPPAKSIETPLVAKGIILIAEGQKPVVLCALDWSELSNGDYDRWRQEIAAAVDTDADRVAVQCIHAHDTPWPDRDAQDILDAAGHPNVIMTTPWPEQTRADAAAAAKAALATLQPCTHVATGSATVEDIASNRRVMGDDGRVKYVRYTRTPDPVVRAEPIGLIDPLLRTLSFYNGDKPVTHLHYYAVHPTSYDGTGDVTPEFVGLARNQCTQEDGVEHIYFTGCAGNITAGKFNDGNTENRRIFTERIHTAMRAAMADAEANQTRAPLTSLVWLTQPAALPPREDMHEADLMAEIERDTAHVKTKSRAALMLTYLRRWRQPIRITALHLNNDIAVLNLPGEAFIEYQIYAQQLRPKDFIAVASYGDLGTGYITMKKSFEEGGYEPVDAFVSGEAEVVMNAAIEKVIALD